jgi:hypothetical protein
MQKFSQDTIQESKSVAARPIADRHLCVSRFRKAFEALTRAKDNNQIAIR